MTTMARGTDRRRDELDLFSDARDSISSARETERRGDLYDEQGDLETRGKESGKF